MEYSYEGPIIINSIKDYYNIMTSVNFYDYVASPFKYFTAWVFVLVVFHKWTFRFFNLMFLSLSVLVVSMYISYVDPKYFKYILIRNKVSTEGNGTVTNVVYHIKGNTKIILDVIYHILPFIFVVWKYGLYYMKYDVAYSLSMSNAVLLIMIYIVLFNVEQVYDLNEYIFVSLVCMLVLVYLCIA